MEKFLFSVLLILLISCTPKTIEKTAIVEPTQSLTERAINLSKKCLITDGHVDLPYRLKVQNFRLTKEFLKIPVESEDGDFDYVRSVEGGLDAPFMSIYLPAHLQQQKGESKKLADSLITMVKGITIEHPDKFEIAYNTADMERLFATKKIALPMGMENGSGIEDDLSNVAYFKKQGISYITLTHSKDNLICDSSYDTTGTWQGLSPFGKEVVAEMNKEGIMVDVSHISDKTFYQVMNLSKTPVIASHSSCRKFIPDFERNMSDDMIIKLGENNGVIMINFGSTFIDDKVKNDRDAYRKKLSAFLKEKELTWQDEASKPLIEEFKKTNPLSFADIKVVADHIDHVVKLTGVDHVGFGSDFDGVGDSLPTGLKDVSDYPNLIEELLRRNYSDEDIEKICSGNLIRVWKSVEKYAASH